MNAGRSPAKGGLSGSAQPPLAATDTSAVPDPTFRSATEKRLCDEIMKREGTWDDASGTYLTRESVLQQRSQLMATVGQALRVDPRLQYRLQSENPNFMYPQCPSRLLRESRTRPADLGIADPKPENVERCMTAAMERRAQPTLLPPSRVGTDDAIEQLEAELLNEAVNSVSRLSADAASTAYDGGAAASIYGTSVTPAAGSGFSAVRRGTRTLAGNATPALADGPSPSPGREPGARLKELPEDPFRLARPEVATRGRARDRSSALQAILDMDCSADMKRTITRMFADPKNAQAISDEEASRRAKRYEEDRQAQLTQQARLLAEERALMDKELAMLK